MLPRTYSSSAAVTRELGANRDIPAMLVGHQVGLAVNLRDEHFAEVLRGHLGHMERTHLAAALDQRHDGLFVALAALRFALSRVLVAFLAADVHLVGLDHLARAAERAEVT